MLVEHQHPPEPIYEVALPWVTYRFMYTNRRVILSGGIAKVRMECANCGVTKSVFFRARYRNPEPTVRTDAKRLEFLMAHQHPGREHPLHWVRPAANPVGARDYIASRAPWN